MSVVAHVNCAYSTHSTHAYLVDSTESSSLQEPTSTTTSRGSYYTYYGTSELRLHDRVSPSSVHAGEALSPSQVPVTSHASTKVMVYPLTMAFTVFVAVLVVSSLDGRFLAYVVSNSAKDTIPYVTYPWFKIHPAYHSTTGIIVYLGKVSRRALLSNLSSSAFSTNGSRKTLFQHHCHQWPSLLGSSTPGQVFYMGLEVRRCH